MSSADQMGLFGEMKPAKPKIRPWRATQLDLRDPDHTFDAADPDDLYRVLEILYGVLVRSRELTRACELRDLHLESKWIERFLEADGGIVGLYVQLRLAGHEIEDFEREIFVPAEECVARLTDLRRELLESLDAEPLDRFLKTESRVKVNEYKIWRELADVELAVGEELGLLTEVEIPVSAHPDVLLPEDVENVMGAFLDGMKEEHDAKPLPKQGKLTTLLKTLPVVWLDAVAQHLELEVEGSRRDREKKMAETLRDPAKLEAIVGSSLDSEERELLERLMEEGGQMPAEEIYGNYGPDDTDGWFWNEQEPHSVLGGLRVHGLVFVGEIEGKGRTAVVPKELRADLVEILGVG